MKSRRLWNGRATVLLSTITLIPLLAISPAGALPVGVEPEHSGLVRQLGVHSASVYARKALPPEKLTGAGKHWWSGLASSWDGRRLVATDDKVVLTSSDSGGTWTTHRVPSVSTLGLSTNVATSSDGRYIFITAEGGGLQVSSDFGVHWTHRVVPNAFMSVEQAYGVAVSANGQKVLLAVGKGLLTSSDAGRTWKVGGVDQSLHYWVDVASSADGQRLAVAQAGGDIWTSVDGGDSWVRRTGNTHQGWSALSTSADGLTILAAGRQSPFTRWDLDYFYLSKDGGISWRELTTLGRVAGDTVSVSADGSSLLIATRLLTATLDEDAVYESVDGGAHWTRHMNYSNRLTLDFLSVSSDGTKVVVADLSNVSNSLWRYQTSVTTPSAPRLPSVVSLVRAVKVSWKRPADTGGGVSRYRAVATPVNGGPSAYCLAYTSLACTIKPLKNGVRYTVKVTASNSAGASTSSVSRVFAPGPTSPRALTVTYPSQGVAHVSWFGPAMAGSGRVLGYRMRTCDVALNACAPFQLLGASVHSANQNGLARRHTYRVDVQARTPAGYGDTASKVFRQGR